LRRKRNGNQGEKGPGEIAAQIAAAAAGSASFSPKSIIVQLQFCPAFLLRFCVFI
jgi:hypothetical protein